MGTAKWYCTSHPVPQGTSKLKLTFFPQKHDLPVRPFKGIPSLFCIPRVKLFPTHPRIPYISPLRSRFNASQYHSLHTSTPASYLLFPPLHHIILRLLHSGFRHPFIASCPLLAASPHCIPDIPCLLWSQPGSCIYTFMALRKYQSAKQDHPLSRERLRNRCGSYPYST